MAISVEKCHLHQRIALKALVTIGTSPRLLMLGLMLPTMFLSMWISNTATTSMMVTIHHRDVNCQRNREFSQYFKTLFKETIEQAGGVDLKLGLLL